MTDRDLKTLCTLSGGCVFESFKHYAEEHLIVIECQTCGYWAFAYDRTKTKYKWNIGESTRRVFYAADGQKGGPVEVIDWSKDRERRLANP